MKKLNCPSCGADMIIDPKTGIGVCKACGTKVQTADYTEIKTKRIIDEARIKEADVSLEKEKIREAKRRDKDAQKTKTMKICFIALGVIIILCILIAVLCTVLGKSEKSFNIF